MISTVSSSASTRGRSAGMARAEPICSSTWQIRACAAGDVNDDGYQDVVAILRDGDDFALNPYLGGANGLATTARSISRPSLGGVETTIEHRASLDRPPLATPRDLLRLSVGLEHPDDLIDDLRAALERVR